MPKFPSRVTRPRLVSIDIDPIQKDSAIAIGMRAYVAATVLRDQPRYGSVILCLPFGAGILELSSEDEAYRDLLAVRVAAEAVESICGLRRLGNLPAARRLAMRVDELAHPLSRRLLAKWMPDIDNLLDDPAAVLAAHNREIAYMVAHRPK